MTGPSRIDRSDRPRLYQQVVERIVAHVLDSGMEAGSRLPPERDLAEQLGVSRATVAQALVALEVLGVIGVHHGSGATLLVRPATAEILHGVQEHEARLPDIVDVRRAIEPRLAALAAERRTDEDVERIAAAIDRMRQDIDGGDRGLSGDEMFYEAVTRAARSSLLARMMQQLADQIRETRGESLSQSGSPEQSLAGQVEVFDAIRRGRPDEAERAMVAHLEVVSDLPMLDDDD